MFVPCAYAKTLEQVMTMLNPSCFIRANKQFVVARDCMKEITIWFGSRLLIKQNIETPEPIYISKNRAVEFKAWIVQKNFKIKLTIWQQSFVRKSMTSGPIRAR